MIPFFDLKRQYQDLKKELQEAQDRVFDKGWFINGSEVDQFEKSFSDFMRVNHSIGCASGTDALELCIRAIDIKPGDEVMVPAMTWIADAEVIKNIGAVPVFVDIDPDTFCISTKEIREKVSSKTRAIIVVHLYGRMAAMDEIVTIGRSKNIKIIEDCAHAHGLQIGGQYAGSFGDLGAFSFYPTKNLGCYGDAGAVVAGDTMIADTIRKLANHGQEERDIHVLSGKTSRLDELQAAYLNVKLNYLNRWNSRRAEIASIYRNELEPWVKFQDHENSIFHQCVIQTTRRDGLKSFLEKEGIKTAIHYPRPLPATAPFFIEGWQHKFPVATKLAEEVLSLPVFPELTDEEVKQITDSIKKFFIS